MGVVKPVFHIEFTIVWYNFVVAKIPNFEIDRTLNPVIAR
jgi:hypothetical protein